MTGGAGFIGSNLTDTLLRGGHSVRVVDNLSTGCEQFLHPAREHESFEFVLCDLIDDKQHLAAAIDGADAVVHLAGNADVRFGWQHPHRDLEENTLATHNVLEAMRATGTKRLVFASTGSVYGEALVIPTPEECPFRIQTSLYAASKVAAEALIGAYATGCGIQASILRFVSVLGPRYTHGHVLDLSRQLLADPTRLRVLGNGSQRKSYMHVEDCCAAVAMVLAADHPWEVYNVGVDDYCTVSDSVGWICERLNVLPQIEFAGGRQGWVGDNPFIYLDTTKIRRAGWRPHFTIREGVEATVDFLAENRWVLDKHDRVDYSRSEVVLGRVSASHANEEEPRRTKATSLKSS